MAPEELFWSVESLNGTATYVRRYVSLKSYTCGLYFILNLHVWIRINKDPE